jgi:aspartyl-tRNA(Asn)/glutamyl-tRNA(Gln) amidotransferase subunit A
VPRFDEIDVIATPTLCITPPLLSEISDADSYLAANRRIVRNTVAVNYLGLCGITLPVGLDRAGMPVGLQIIAPRGRRKGFWQLRSRRSGCLATPPSGLGPRHCSPCERKR